MKPTPGAGVGVRDDLIAEIIPFGLLELDAAGTVLFYEPVKERASMFTASNVRGRNFFTEVAPVAQVREFRERFDAFMRGGDSPQRVTLVVPSERGAVQVQFLLVRIRERTALPNERLALVRIRPEIYHAAVNSTERPSR
ncbi:MAG: hypothetical protein ACRD68_15390 [Pyrinomonadaceae bacterium]